MPTGLGTSAFDISPEQDPRAVLADWMADKDNPFFARMLVNRYWKHFMGRGLVEPEDDMRGTNPPPIRTCWTPWPAISSKADST